MAIKTFTTAIVAVIGLFFSVNALALHSYEPFMLSATKGSAEPVEKRAAYAIENGNFIPLPTLTRGKIKNASSNSSVYATQILFEQYYLTDKANGVAKIPIRMLSGESLSELAKNPSLYISRKEINGKVCAALWRYGRGAQVKQNYGYYNSQGIAEPTPFYDQNSPLYKGISVTSSSGSTQTVISMLGNGSNISEYDYRFAIHKVGSSFGAGREYKDNLVFTLFEYHYSYIDGERVGPKTNLAEKNWAIISYMATRLSFQQIVDLSSEQAAYNECSEHNVMLIPIPRIE